MLSTEWICVFHMTHKISGYYFPKHINKIVFVTDATNVSMNLMMHRTYLKQCH
jgi:hypothetical protein